VARPRRNCTGFLLPAKCSAQTVGQLPAKINPGPEPGRLAPALAAPHSVRVDHLDGFAMQPSTPRLYLDDLAIGDRYLSATCSVDVEQIKAFAEQFDPQPFHLDEAAAARSLFGGLAASGWHTAALTMRLLVQSVPLHGGLIGAGSELDWPSPTRPGDTLHVESEIVRITPSRSKPDRGVVTCQVLTLNQHDQVVQKAIAKLLVMRRPPAA
jgi:acyl dehydratase